MAPTNFSIIQQLRQNFGGNQRVNEIVYQLLTTAQTILATELLTLSVKKVLKSMWRKLAQMRTRQRRDRNLLQN